MNLVEVFIKEIHSENEECDKEYTWITADLTTDCYGRVERKKYLFEEKEWMQIKKQGYFFS